MTARAGPHDGGARRVPGEDPRVTRTRAKVLAAAFGLLSDTGFGNITVDDISERSGVSRSTLYRHWESRDDILRDAFASSAVALGDDAGATDLREDLRRYARAVAYGLRAVWGRAAATLAVSALDDPAQRRMQRVFARRSMREVAALLDRAAHRGELSAPTDDDALDDIATQLLAPLFFRYLFSERPLDDAFADAHADRVHAALLRADRSRAGTGDDARAGAPAPAADGAVTP